MLPSEVRTRVLDQHSELRERIEQLEKMAHQTLESASEGAALLTELGEFLRRLQEHMYYEDKALKPVLAEADPWGPERVLRFERDHEQQRGWIEGLTKDGPSRTSDELAMLTLGFLQVLRRDMEDEEADVLSAELLKDDPVVVHSEPE